MSMKFHEDRQVVISDDSLSIRGSTVVIQKILELSQNKEEIEILINSNGGNMRALQNIISALEISGCKLKTINIGAAYSAAAVLFLEGEERLMFKNSELMFHEPILMTPKEVRLSELKEIVKVGQDDYDMFAGELARVSLLSKNQIMRKIKGKNWVIGPEEALKFGISTGTITSIE